MMPDARAAAASVLVHLAAAGAWWASPDLWPLPRCLCSIPDPAPWSVFVVGGGRGQAALSAEAPPPRAGEGVSYVRIADRRCPAATGLERLPSAPRVTLPPLPTGASWPSFCVSVGADGRVTGIVSLRHGWGETAAAARLRQARLEPARDGRGPAPTRVVVDFVPRPRGRP